MRYIAARPTGFTLIEVLVISPIVILFIGFFVSLLVNLTGESLVVREKNVMAYNLQEGLDWIQRDSVKATSFLNTTGTLPSPQGKDNTTAAFTSTDSLVIGVIGTDKDPANPDRSPVYYANQPNPCGVDQRSNQLFITKAIFFLKDGTLWRRSVIPTYNTNSTPDDFTVCSVPWQRNSCADGQTAAICKTKDSKLMENVSAFTIKYYADAAATTVLPSAQARSAKAIVVDLGLQQSIAGKTLTQNASINVTRQNDIDADLVAPTGVPAITYDINNTLSATFNWNIVPNATSYKVSYSINGGGFINGGNVFDTTYTVNTTRSDTIVFRVAARNGFGVAGTAQSTAQIPSKVPCDLKSNWVNYGSPYPATSFTKTSAGVVALNGLIRKATAATQFETICTLPEGYRPSSRLIFAPATSGTTQGRIDIDPNGDLIYVYGSTGWLSLNGINFLAAGTAPWSNMTGANGWVAYPGYATPQVTADSTGRAFIQGLARSGTTTAGTVAFNIPGSIPPMDGVDIYPARAPAVGSMQIANNSVYYRGTGGNGHWSLQAMYYPSGRASWSTPALSAGWVKYSPTPGYNAAQYTKNSDDIVSLRGLIKSGTATPGTVLFTLPAGYRPADRIICSVISNPDAFARLDILTSGSVMAQEGTNNGWLSLAGCDFLAEL